MKKRVENRQRGVTERNQRSEGITHYEDTFAFIKNSLQTHIRIITSVREFRGRSSGANHVKIRCLKSMGERMS